MFICWTETMWNLCEIGWLTKGYFPGTVTTRASFTYQGNEVTKVAKCKGMPNKTLDWNLSKITMRNKSAKPHLSFLNRQFVCTFQSLPSGMHKSMKDWINKYDGAYKLIHCRKLATVTKWLWCYLKVIMVPVGGFCLIGCVAFHLIPLYQHKRLLVLFPAGPNSPLKRIRIIGGKL